MVKQKASLIQTNNPNKMFQQTPKNRVLFSHSFKLVVLAFFGVFSLLSITLLTPKTANAVTANTINFQARLEAASGAIAADGNYNVQFKLYSSSQGGTALWTETYQNSNSQGIRVVNGYLTANLGSITAFPSTINWNQQLWLTMNIGGTSTGATVTWDGEMDPRLQLTAVPYAFQAGQLAQYNNTTGYTSTLQLQAPTGGNQTFQIADQGAPGTYTLLTTQGATGSFIQNQSASAQTANFWIQSGSAGSIGAVIQGASGQTADIFRVLDSGNRKLLGVDASGQVTFKGNGLAGTTYSLTLDAGSTGTNSSNAALRFVGYGSGVAHTAVVSASYTGALQLEGAGGAAAGVISVAANNTTVGFTVKGAASQTADLLQLQDSNGVVNARISSMGQIYSNNNIGAGNANGPLSNSTGGWATLGSLTAAANSGLVVQGHTGQTANLVELSDGNGSLMSGFNPTGQLFYQSGSYTGTLQQGALTANRTYALPDASGTICLDSAVNNCGYATSSGSGNYIQNSTTQQANANFNIEGSGTIGTNLTVTNNATVGGTLTVASFNSLKANLTSSTVITTDQAQIAQAPTANEWHDLLAFNRYATPIYEQYNIADGAWEGGTLNSNLFANKQNQNIRVFDGTATSGARWTWNSPSFSYSAGAWLSIGFAYSNPSATKTVEVESSADGNTWTVRHLSTGNTQNGTPAWFHLDGYGGDSYIRVTIIGTTSGAASLTGLQLLSDRWGDQGGGSELSIPYSWNGAQQIAIGANAVPANGNLTVGTNTTAASGGVYFGTDTNLYRGGTNLLQTDDAFSAAGGYNVGGTTVLTSARILQNVTADTGILTSGTLSIARGGTGATTIGSAGSLAYSDGSSYNFTGVGTAGQCLLSAGTSAPTWGSCAAANSMTGTGTANTIAVFTGANTIANSILTQSGTQLTVGSTANQAIRLLAGATTQGIELGRTDGIGSTPYFDFHSGTTATDYDARIGATGGTGTSGGGTLQVTAAALAASGTIQGTQLKSTVATGTAPLTVNSTTVVTNLNADKLDGLDASAFCQGSCVAGGAATGDLTGTYPNPTVAGIQGTSVTITSLTANQSLVYNGTAWVNSLLGNNNLASGTYTNITGVGTLGTLAVSGTASIGDTLNLQGIDALQVGGTSVLTSSRVLQNVTANTSILTTGTLTVARGGTGASSFTSGGILYGNGTGAIQASTVLTNGQLLIGDGSGFPTIATLLSSGGITVTNGMGSIAIGTDNTICKTTGNCAGVGGDITGTGTANTIAMFTASGAIGNSILSQSGTTIGLSGTLQATTVDANNVQTNGQTRLDVSGNLTNIGSYTGSGNITAGGVLGITGAGTSYISNGSLAIGGTSTGRGRLEVDQSSDTSSGGIGIVNSGVSGSERLYVDGSGAAHVESGPGGTGSLALNSGGGTVSVGGNLTGGGNLQFSGTSGSSYIMSALGLGTTTPQAGSALTIGNGSWISSVDAAGTGYINMFQVNSSNQIQIGAALNVDGGIVLPADSGPVTLVDEPFTGGASTTVNSYTLGIGQANALTVYGENDGSGNAQNVRVGIGNSITPNYTLDVGGDINTSGVLRINGNAICTASGCSTSTNYIQNSTSVQSGANFNIGGNGVIGGSLTTNSLNVGASKFTVASTGLTSIVTTTGGPILYVKEAGSGYGNANAAIVADTDNTGGTQQLFQGRSGGTNVFSVQSNGAITSSSTIQGTQLISTVAAGTAPLTVASSTVVANFNADLLDGYDSTAFYRQSLGDVATDFNNYTATGSYRVAGWSTAGVANGPVGSYQWGMLTVEQYGGSSYVNQTYIPDNGHGEWTRNLWAGTWRSWQEIWANTNDGAGSGLDADTLDGHDTSYFIQNTTTAQTANFNISGTGTIGSSLQIGSALGSAAANTLMVNAGTLGSTAGNELAVASFGAKTGNADSLTISAYRTVSGTDWSQANMVLGRNVDSTTRAGAYITFGNANKYLGVNTLNPSAALDVSGAIHVSGVISSGVATGTAPLTVSSTTRVLNFNADLLDDQQGSYYLNASNFNAGTLSDSLLSSNVVLVNNNQTITGQKTFSATANFTASGTGLTVTNDATVGGKLTVAGTISTGAISRIDPIEIRGTGNNRASARLVKIGSATVAVGSGRGLNLTIISKTDHSIISNTTYDTYGTTASSDNLATAINAMDNSQIGILTSYDAWEAGVDANLRAAFLHVGLTKAAAASSSSSSIRRPYAAIFEADATTGVNTAKAEEVLLTADAAAPYAEMRGWLEDGSFDVSGSAPNAIMNSTGTAVALMVDENNNVDLQGNVLQVGGTTVLTSARVLQNVTTITASSTIQGTRLISTVATGTAPLTVNSTTVVTNLNADLLDGLDSTDFARSSGGTGYIWNQGASAQSANFYISGTGTAATLNATTALQTASTTRIDSSGNLLNIGTITSQGVNHTTDSIVLNQTFAQGASASTTYYKLATLPATSTNTYDHLRLEATLNSGWAGNQNSYIDATFGNRNGFTYQYTLRGPAVNVHSTLVAYQNADTSVDIYIVLATGAYTTASYSILENEDATVYANPNANKTTAVPSGTVVFDASLTGTYPAVSTVDNSGNTTFNGSLSAQSTIQGTQLKSTVATGTAPLTVASSTVVANFNADLLDGHDSSYFATVASLGGYVQLQGSTPGTAQTGNINVSGTVIAGTFSGNGASLTSLNASNLASGTVNTARISGSYTGITGTGALDAGSITAGFGAINVGTDNITTTGQLQGGTARVSDGVNTTQIEGNAQIHLDSTASGGGAVTFDTSYIEGSAYADSGSSWSSPAGALDADGTPASASPAAGTTSSTLTIKGFNAKIPTSATITGIDVRLASASCPLTSGNIHVAMTKDGSTMAGSASTSSGTTCAVNYSGGLWGTTWTPAQVNSATFGVQVWVDSTSGMLFYVDAIQVDVHYSVPTSHFTLGVDQADATAFKLAIGGELGSSDVLRVTTSQFQVGMNGTSTAPAYSFMGDSSTGMYLNGTGQLGFAAGGTKSLVVSSSQIMAINGGDRTVPAYTFSNDSDTGIYNLSQYNEVGFVAGGKQILTVDNYSDNGAVYIYGNVNLQSSSNLSVSGTLSTALSGTTTTNGVCHSGADIDASGDTSVRGLVACSTAPNDYAEMYPTESDVTAGDLVAVTPNMLTYQAQGADAETGEVKSMGTKQISILKRAAVGDNALGFISTAPYQTIGKDIPESAHRLPVALNGRVPVKVNNEGGVIHAGDRLSLSSTPGVATKAYLTGRTYAVALEDFSGTSGTIMAYVQTGWYEAPVSDVLQANSIVAGKMQINGNASIGADLNVAGMATITDLTVTGSATIGGTLTVQGAVNVGTLTVNGHIITRGNAPTIALGQALGQGTQGQQNTDPVVMVDGTDTTGTVTITAGTQQLANGVLAQLTFAQAFDQGTTFKAVLTPTNDNATNLRTYIQKTANGFNIVSRDTPAAGTQYQFDYIVMGAQQTAQAGGSSTPL